MILKTFSWNERTFNTSFTGVGPFGYVKSPLCDEQAQKYKNFIYTDTNKKAKKTILVCMVCTHLQLRLKKDYTLL